MAHASEHTSMDDSTLVSGDSMMGDAIAIARLGPGKSIGSYIVLARRGVGRSGVLYHAFESSTEQNVAIRLLPPQEPKARDADAGEIKAIVQLHREADELAVIRHRNLVGIHEVGELHGVIYLVMDYLGGGTFRAWLDEQRRGWREIVDCLVGIGAGLAVLHRAGLVHRDVRPDNILFDDEGRPKLVDYAFYRGGFSSRRSTVLTKRDEDETSAESLNAPLIRMGTWIGTPAYMAPEQYAGDEVDGRADQFAFCVMLFEALYGRRPFEARTLDGMFLAVEEGRMVSVDDRRVPKRIRQVLVRGLAHDPAERWPSMDAMLDALSAEPNTSWRRRAAIAALVTSLVAAVAALSMRGPLSNEDSSADSAAASPLDPELDRAQSLIRSAAPTDAIDVLAALEPQLAEAPAYVRARHDLLWAQTLGTDERAESLLYDALIELTADPEAPIDAPTAKVTRELTIELGLRQELRAVAEATNKRQLDVARKHVENAQRLLAQQPNPQVDEAIASWQEYYAAAKDADR